MKKFSYIIIGIGLTLVIFAISLVTFSNYTYKRLINSFEENKDNISFLEDIKNNENKEKSEITEEMIGLIKIPSIDLKYPILEGTENKILKQSVGHFESTSLPGESGNMTLIGHNNFILSEPFKNLDKVSIGELITISTTQKDYKYEVIKSYTVDPYDKSIVKSSEDTKLTLVTCTDDASERYILEALLISEDDDKNKK